MNYEGVTVPGTLPVGTSGCEPSSAPAGTTFRCSFYGFAPGAQITSLTVSLPNGQPVTLSPISSIAADGSVVVAYTATTLGLRTMTVAVGTATQQASFTVTPQSFPITFVESTFGSVTVNTKPGLACALGVILPNGQALNDSGLNPRVSNAQGNVAWVYTKPAGTSGNGTHVVFCTSGAETPSASASFSAP